MQCFAKKSQSCGRYVVLNLHRNASLMLNHIFKEPGEISRPSTGSLISHCLLPLLAQACCYNDTRAADKQNGLLGYHILSFVKIKAPLS